MQFAHGYTSTTLQRTFLLRQDPHARAARRFVGFFPAESESPEAPRFLDAGTACDVDVFLGVGLGDSAAAGDSAGVAESSGGGEVHISSGVIFESSSISSCDECCAPRRVSGPTAKQRARKQSDRRPVRYLQYERRRNMCRQSRLARVFILVVGLDFLCCGDLEGAMGTPRFLDRRGVLPGAGRRCGSKVKGLLYCSPPSTIRGPGTRSLISGPDLWRKSPPASLRSVTRGED